MSLHFFLQVKEVFQVLGRYDEGHTQYTSLYWGSLCGFLPRNFQLASDNKQDVLVEVQFLDLLVRNHRFPKPRFVGTSVETAQNNSLANDMWKAFLNETGADLTITCESFLDDDEDQENNEVVEQKPARATFR